MQANLDILKDFFTVIKGLDDSLRAFFITGVSQIPKASIFSGLNNPNNISLDPKAATLLGYTKEEVMSYFSPYIERLARLNDQEPKETEESIRTWYNGYRFSKEEVKVYNPFSLHYLFEKNEFDNYWFDSATPSFLLHLLKKNNFILTDVENSRASKKSLQSIVLENPQLVPLLFQTGYLTISSYIKETNSYTLTYPNHEVQQSYILSLITSLTDKTEEELDTQKDTMRQALESNDIPAFCSSLSSIFAHVPYQIEDTTEASYHRALCFIMKLVGFPIDCEVLTNKGRIDMVIFTGKFTYVFELKVNAKPEAALKQIEEMGYYERYLGGKETVVLVGLSFNKLKGVPTITCASKTLSKVCPL